MADLIRFFAAGLYAFLIFAWLTVATRTLRCALSGWQLLPPVTPAPVQTAVDMTA